MSLRPWAVLAVCGLLAGCTATPAPTPEPEPAPSNYVSLEPTPSPSPARPATACEEVPDELDRLVRAAAVSWNTHYEFRMRPGAMKMVEAGEGWWIVAGLAVEGEGDRKPAGAIETFLTNFPDGDPETRVAIARVTGDWDGTYDPPGRLAAVDLPHGQTARRAAIRCISSQ